MIFTMFWAIFFIILFCMVAAVLFLIGLSGGVIDLL
jgi:hypothetical protein